ncbi:hypothetical protein [Fulvivirga lutimaris]|uniref:hypothetical protein n=1 Tax=Fulvivirga lutimaris TaxID=1819566 RepID=UPI0012BCD75E|nr:hypothetical protein [Fulvivirga lutimaris]MTI38809.1 hypothetical protein [Fulvivirga lutimaris]
MAKRNSKKDEKKKEKPTVNPELDGFNIEIDSFGELRTSFSIDKINEFLNKNVEDKKLIDREDYKEIKNKPADEEE